MARGAFVAEGRLVVERLLRERRYEVESLLVNEAALRALAVPLEAVADVPVYVGPSALFEELTGHDFHRGCLGLVRRPAPRAVAEVAERASMLIVLEGVSNPDNLGGVFRNAAAFGADGVLLGPGSGDPLYRKAIRTSTGTTLSVPFARFDDIEAGWPAPLAHLRARGFELLALTPHPAARWIEDYRATLQPGRRVALLVGSEGAGLSPAVLALADQRLRIAICADVDSLNLAVATGIALERLTLR